MERGIINFYKDGKDLGEAFNNRELKEGYLFPFLQIQEICQVSIFHPSVYPKYRDPIIELKMKETRIKEPEPQPSKSMRYQLVSDSKGSNGLRRSNSRFIEKP